MGILRFAVLASVFLSAVVACSEEQPQFRVWTNRAGTKTVEAALVKVEGKYVHLQRHDGKTVKFPLKQLSAADQEFVASGAGTRDEGEREEGDSGHVMDPRDALVLVEGTKAGRPFRYRGVLIMEKNGFGYVLAEGSAATLDKTVKSTRVIFFPGTKKQRAITAQVKSGSRRTNWSVLQVRGRGFPELDIFADRTLPAVGSRLSVISLVSTKPGAKNEISSLRATLKKIYKSKQGSPQFCEIQGDGVDELPLGLALDDQNRFAGILLGQPSQGARRRSQYRSRPVRMMTAQHFVDSWTPTLPQAVIFPVSWNENEIAISLRCSLHDPFGRVEKTKLLVGRRVGEEPILQKEGQEWGRVSDEMAIVDVEQTDRGEFRLSETAPWIDRGGLPKTAGPLSYVMQLEFESSDKTVGYSKPVVAELSFHGRFKGEAYHFLRIYKDSLLPHPGGGITMTSAASREAAAKLPKSEMEGDFPHPVRETKSFAGITPDRFGATRILPRHESGLGAWGRDGKIFFAASRKEHLVRRLNVPDLNSEVEIELDGAILDLTLAKDCLLVLTKAENAAHLWGLDPATLKPLWRRVPRPGAVVPEGYFGVASLASSPVSPYGYFTFGRNPTTIQVVDVADGNAVHCIETANSSARDYTPKQLQLSPNGKRLFAICNRTVARFNVEGSDLVFVQSTPEGVKTYSLEQSPDGKALMVLGDSRGNKTGTHPEFSRGVFLYSPDDLSKPITAFVNETRLENFSTVGLPSRRFLTLGIGDRKRQINIMSDKGRVVHRVQLAGGNRFYLHPDNKRLLVQQGNRFDWVDLPAHVLDGSTDVVRQADTPENLKRLMNLLEWRIDTVDRSPNIVWQEVEGVGRACKLYEPFDRSKAHAWTHDGKQLFYQERQIISRFVRDELRTTHQLKMPDGRFGSHIPSPLSMCPEGLLVRDGKWLVIVNPDTLLPKRIVADNLGFSSRYYAAAKRNYLVKTQFHVNETWTVSTIDLESDSPIDEWSISAADSKARGIMFGPSAHLTPDGGHFVTTGRPALHLAIDESGAIKEQEPVAQEAPNDFAQPRLPVTAGAVAFWVSRQSSGYFMICLTSDMTKASIISDRTDKPWILDPKTKLFWNATNDGELVSFRKQGEAVHRVKTSRELLGSAHFSEFATAPPDGGALLFDNRNETWWIELSGDER